MVCCLEVSSKSLSFPSFFLRCFKFFSILLLRSWVSWRRWVREAKRVKNEQQQQQQKKSSGVKKRATEMKKEQTERQTPEAGVLPLRATFGFVEATTGGGATPAPALAWKAETGLGF